MPTRVKGCRNCSRRRINCDLTQPRCRKCARDNLECYGLSGTYRWVGASGVRKTGRNNRQVPANGFDVPAGDIQLSATDHNPLRAADADPMASSAVVLTRGVPNHPDQWAMNYFAEQITPWMCPILRADNECKTHLLPLAASSELVFDAVAATTFHRLAYYGCPEFAAKGERYKASAIKGLLRSCRDVCSPSGSSDDRLFAAATLLILMYDEMVAAQDYFTTLARIIGSMRDFVDFSALAGSPELHRYLVEQFGILTIFSLPHVDTQTATVLQTSALEFVRDFAKATVEHGHNPSFLAYCWETILTVWHNQKHDPSFNASGMLEELCSRIESNGDIAEFDHYLTWVYFMAAAASPTPPLRKFFKDRLFCHTITFGWKNVAMMHDFLEELESAGPEWPSRLQSHKQYICA